MAIAGIWGLNQQIVSSLSPNEKEEEKQGSGRERKIDQAMFTKKIKAQNIYNPT